MSKKKNEAKEILAKKAEKKAPKMFKYAVTLRDDIVMTDMASVVVSIGKEVSRCKVGDMVLTQPYLGDPVKDRTGNLKYFTHKEDDIHGVVKKSEKGQLEL